MKWRKYVLKYFHSSPFPFLQNNEYFTGLSWNLKVSLIKYYISMDAESSNHFLPTFYTKFEILFKDHELSFRADDQLICMILSSL